MPCLIVEARNEAIFTQTWHATSLHSSGKEAFVNQTLHAQRSPGKEADNVGTWRAMSDRYGEQSDGVNQTWRATSLHSPGKEAVVSQTWHALHSPGNECIVPCQEDFEPKSETLFDLQGRKVTSDLDNLKPGVYISIKGNKPSKIIVR